MNAIGQKQKNIVEEFSKFPQWEDRYKYIIELGKNLPAFPEEHRLEKNKVKGCQSQVWLHAWMENGKVYYHADSDALIVKGLASLLVQVFSGHDPKEIMAAGTDFLADIGLTSHLSQSRSNGLAAMVRQFKNYAVAFSLLPGLGA